MFGLSLGRRLCNVTSLGLGILSVCEKSRNCSKSVRFCKVERMIELYSHIGTKPDSRNFVMWFKILDIDDDVIDENFARKLCFHSCTLPRIQ